MTSDAHDTIERLNNASRRRTLTDEERRQFFAAVKAVTRSKANGGRSGPRGPQQHPCIRTPRTWTEEMDAAFFDAIADGRAIAAAGRLVGKNNSEAQSRFRRARIALGWERTQ